MPKQPLIYNNENSKDYKITYPSSKSSALRCLIIPSSSIPFILFNLSDSNFSNLSFSFLAISSSDFSLSLAYKINKINMKYKI